MPKTILVHIALFITAGLIGAVGLHFVNGWSWASIFLFALATPSIVILAILVWFKRGYDPDKDMEKFDKQQN